MYSLKCHPDSLVGIDAFWNLYMDTKDQGIADELVEFITKLYVPTELDGKDRLPLFAKYIQAFVERCSKLFKDATTNEEWLKDEIASKTVKRVILLLTEIVDMTESLYNVDNLSLASLYRGDKVSLTIDNNIYVSYDSAKKVEMKVNGNTTLLEVKKKLAKELTKISWRNVVLKRPNKKPEIKDKHNLRTLRDMRVKLGERLVAASKPIIQRPQEPLVINDVLNPKAVAAFTNIFKRFEKNNKLGPEELVGFAALVLDQKNITAEDSKIKELISSWDKDKDGRLSEEEFFDFLKLSSFNKPHIVWNNLHNLGFGPDLLPRSTEEAYSEEDLARHYVLKDTQLLSKLFELLERSEDIGTITWDLFNRLPPIAEILNKILYFKGIEDRSHVNWETVIDTASAFKTLYSLYILDYLIEENSDEGNKAIEPFIEGDVNVFKRGWRNEFIKLGGFVHLIKILTGYIHKGITSRSDMVIFSFLMKSITNYILASVTLKNKDIYKNIAFIGNPMISLKLLIKGAPEAKKNQGSLPKDSIEKLKEVIRTHNVETSTTIPIEPGSEVKTNDKKVRFDEEYTAQGPVYGPELPPHLRQDNAASTSTQTEAPKTEKTENIEAFHYSKLVESEDFIQFRETLRSINDDSISKLNLEETLKFVSMLCENILSKTTSAEFEDINIIKLGLSVFFSLLLANPEFLKKAILTNEVKLLSDNSSFKAEGYSDLVSFLLAGLLTKRHFIFSRYFNNAFTVIMRESGSVEVQVILVKAVLGNLMRDDLSSRNLAKYIDIACAIIEGICSEDTDPKMLISKSDLNSIINMQTLFFYTLDSLLSQASPEATGSTPGGQQTEAPEQDNNLIINHFKLLEKLLQLEPKLKLEVSKRSEKRYIPRLFADCLFAISNDPTSVDKAGKDLLCKYPQTRQACYDFISELVRNNVDNCEQMMQHCLGPLSERLPRVNTWKYTPNKDKKSDQGFLGINNLHNICYINSMLQQLYMTPAFRYGILSADDFKEKQLVEDKEGRKIDDNLFHQLQKMFAYLDHSERGCYHPYEFCYSFKDHGGLPLNVSIQQDTQEFFNIFFDRIETSLKNTPFKNITKDVYGGKTVDLLGCSNCGHLRRNEQMFYNLSLEVKNMKNIKESLDKLTTEDIICDYKCEHCEQRCDVTKRPLIKDCPNVLIVYLSRLIFDLDVLQNVKINTRYEFPMDINLKEYTYDHFLQTNPAEPEVKEGEEKEQESQEVHKMTEEAPPAKEKASVPAELRDEDYDYSLAGILVHRGHAEGGHYYSYININRHDPKRPKNTKDNWVEFNDTLIQEFKASKIEEECFGSGTAATTSVTDVEEEIANIWDNSSKYGTTLNWENSSGRSAYILVYEKKLKKPLSLEFTDANIPSKEEILKNFVQEDQLNQVKEEVHENVTTVSIPYYGIKPYISKNLETEVYEDNYRFLMEQHVYSKEFLTFVTKVSVFPQLGDFNPKTLPRRILDNKIPERMKDLLGQMYRIQMSLFQTVLSRTEDNDCADKFTHNMMKIISLCPELTGDWIIRDLYQSMPSVLNLLVNCPDGSVRRNMGELIAHLIIVHCNYFEIELDTDFEPNLDKLEAHPDQDQKFYQDTGKVVMHILVKLYSIFGAGKTVNYKRMESYFKMWYTLAKNNQQLTEWLLRRANSIRKFIDFYMSKTTTQYDYKSVYYMHEQALDHCVRMVGHLLSYVRAHNDEFWLTKKGALIHMQPNENEVIYSDHLYDKLMKENFVFNNYKSLKRLLAFGCFQNEVLSTVLLVNILRNLSYGLENCVSYLEALRELVYIKDDFVAYRRELVFGVPTVLDEVDFQRHLKFGFQINKNLERQSVNYISSLKVTSGVPTFLKCIYDVSEKSESTCYIMIVYFLQMVNADESLFLHLLRFPSPCHQFETLYQWIFWFIKSYTEREKRGYETIINQYKASKLYEPVMKENLTLLEDHIENYARCHHKTESEEMVAVPFKTQDIFTEGDANSVLNREVYCNSRLLPLAFNPIVGSVVAEENQNDFKIAEDKSGQLTLRVVELRTRLADSFATGLTNLAIPQAAYTGTRIYEQDVPKNTRLHKFFDFEGKYFSAKHPSYPGERDEASQVTGKHEINYAEGIQVIPEDQLENRLDSDDEVSFGDKESWRQASVSQHDAALIGQMNSIAFRETHYILKISATNTTDHSFGLAIRLRPIEGRELPNLYFPRAQMNFNIKNDKTDLSVVYLTKIDPHKPLGDFAIDVIFAPLKDYESQYHTNNLVFAPSIQPVSLEVHKSNQSDKAGRRLKEDSDKSSEEGKDHDGQSPNHSQSQDQSVSTKESAIKPDQSEA